MISKKIPYLLLLAFLTITNVTSQQVQLQDFNVYMHRKDTQYLEIGALFNIKTDLEEIRISGPDQKSVAIDSYIASSHPSESLAPLIDMPGSKYSRCSTFKPNPIKQEDSTTFTAICYPNKYTDNARPKLMQFMVSDSNPNDPDSEDPVSSPKLRNLVKGDLSHPQVDEGQTTPDTCNFHVSGQNRLAYIGFEKDETAGSLTIATRDFENPNTAPITPKKLKVDFANKNFKMAISEVEGQTPAAVFYSTHSRSVIVASLTETLENEIDTQEPLNLTDQLIKIIYNSFKPDDRAAVDLRIRYIHFDTPSKVFITTNYDAYLNKQILNEVFACDFNPKSTKKFENCVINDDFKEQKNIILAAIPQNLSRGEYLILTETEVILYEKDKQITSRRIQSLNGLPDSPYAFEKVRDSQRNEYYAIFRHLDDTGILVDIAVIHNIEIIDNLGNYQVSANLRNRLTLTAAVVTPDYFIPIQENLVIMDKYLPKSPKTKIQIEGSRFDFNDNDNSDEFETQSFSFNVVINRDNVRKVNVYLSNKAGTIRKNTNQDDVISIDLRVGEESKFDPRISSIDGNNVRAVLEPLEGQEKYISIGNQPSYLEKYNFTLTALDSRLIDYRMLNPFMGIAIVETKEQKNVAKYFECKTMKESENIVCHTEPGDSGTEVKGGFFGQIINKDFKQYYFATKENDDVYIHIVQLLKKRIAKSSTPIPSKSAHEFSIVFGKLIRRVDGVDQEPLNALYILLAEDFKVRIFYAIGYNIGQINEIPQIHDFPEQFFCPQHIYVNGENNVEIPSNCNMARLKRSNKHVSFVIKYKLNGFIEETVDGQTTFSQIPSIEESDKLKYMILPGYKQFDTCKLGTDSYLIDPMDFGESYVTDSEGLGTSVDLKRLIRNVLHDRYPVHSVQYYCVPNSKYLIALVNQEILVFLKLDRNDILKNSMAITMEIEGGDHAVESISNQYYYDDSHFISFIIKKTNGEEIHTSVNLKYNNSSITLLNENKKDNAYFYVRYENDNQVYNIPTNVKINTIDDLYFSITANENIEDLEVKTYNLEEMAAITGSIRNVRFNSKLEESEKYVSFTSRREYQKENKIDGMDAENFRGVKKINEQYYLIIEEHLEGETGLLSTYVHIGETNKGNLVARSILFSKESGVCINIQAVENDGIVAIAGICRTGSSQNSNINVMTAKLNEINEKGEATTTTSELIQVGLEDENSKDYILRATVNKQGYFMFTYNEKIGTELIFIELTQENGLVPLSLEGNHFELENGRRYVNIQVIENPFTGDIGFLCVLDGEQDIDVFTLAKETNFLKKSEVNHNYLEGDILKHFTCNLLSCAYLTENLIKANTYSISMTLIGEEEKLVVTRVSFTEEYVVPVGYKFGANLEISEKMITVMIDEESKEHALSNAVFKRNRQKEQKNQMFNVAGHQTQDSDKPLLQKIGSFQLDAIPEKDMIGRIIHIDYGLFNVITIHDMKLQIKSPKLKMENLEKNMGLAIWDTHVSGIIQIPINAFFNKEYDKKYKGPVQGQITDTSIPTGSDPNGKGSDPNGKGSDPNGKGSDPTGKGSDPTGKGSDPTGNGLPKVVIIIILLVLLTIISVLVIGGGIAVYVLKSKKEESEDKSDKGSEYFTSNEGETINTGYQQFLYI